METDAGNITPETGTREPLPHHIFPQYYGISTEEKTRLRVSNAPAYGYRGVIKKFLPKSP